MGWRRAGQKLKPKGVGLKGHVGREVFWGKKRFVLVAQDADDPWKS